MSQWLKNWATREEIVDAILMTITVGGIKPVVLMLPEAIEIYEKKLKCLCLVQHNELSNV